MTADATAAVDVNLALLVAILTKVGVVELSDAELATAMEAVAERGVNIAYVETPGGTSFGPTMPTRRPSGDEKTFTTPAAPHYVPRYLPIRREEPSGADGYADVSAHEHVAGIVEKLTADPDAAGDAYITLDQPYRPEG